MNYEVVVLARAERELAKATDRIAKEDPETSRRWFNGFIHALLTLGKNPERCSLAPEGDLFPYEVRQFFYRTKSRVPTRALFTIVGSEVKILMIRRPGQDLVTRDEL